MFCWGKSVEEVLGKGTGVIGAILEFYLAAPGMSDCSHQQLGLAISSHYCLQVLPGNNCNQF